MNLNALNSLAQQHTQSNERHVNECKMDALQRALPPSLLTSVRGEREREMEKWMDGVGELLLGKGRMDR